MITKRKIAHGTYTKKLIKDNGEEFVHDMELEFITECPYCGDLDSHKLYTNNAHDRYSCTCMHCEKSYLLSYIAEEDVQIESGMLEENQEPLNFRLFFEVYRIEEDPADVKKSCSACINIKDDE